MMNSINAQTVRSSMKALLYISLFTGLFALNSCKKDEDEENELSIELKAGNGYIFTDGEVDASQSPIVDVYASTIKPKDPIIRFNISESKNGGELQTILNQNIYTESYEYMHHLQLDTTEGTTYRYVYTIANKDGKSKQIDLNLIVK